jgi:hypothetical protein
MSNELQQAVFRYVHAGLCTLPANRQVKYPCIKTWKQFQDRLPTKIELEAWFSNSPDGLCIIAGAVSGNLEIIDFDLGGELFGSWCEMVKTQEPTLIDRLVVETTQSGGWHVMYQCETDICGSMKLAQRRVPVDAKDIYLKKGREHVRISGKEFAVCQDDGGKYVIVTLIETRGQGGLFVCTPTAGYELVQGELTCLPVLTESQRQILLDAAWALNEYIPKPAPIPTGSDATVLRPGDEYNARGNMAELLRSHGWELSHTSGDKQRWRRPGKEIGWSATLWPKDNVFYVFSSNAAPFKADKAYSPFMTYTLLEHNGDFKKAALELSKQGYGQKSEPVEDVDLSHLAGTDDDDDETFISKIRWNGLRLKTLAEMETDFQGLNKPIINGLLREGETMNIIAAPKVGKSWLVNSLSISLASGLDWLGFKTELGRVLLIDNELHENTLTYRYKTVSEAMGLETRLYNKNLIGIPLRGYLKDLNELQGLFAQFRPQLFKVIIIDAFYRILPEGMDENDNGAMAKVYNTLDKYANQLKCAFILIHHTSKGNQSLKSITDVGAGAGAQSRAVDTHLTLREHEDEDTVVMDAVARSWPPVKSLVLRKNHPLFEIDYDADPSELKGAEKKRESKKEPTVEEFVDQCIATQDPCIAGSVVEQARQLFDFSEYKTKALLDVALDRQLALRIKVGSKIKYVKNRKGFNGDKWQLAAAVMEHNPDMTTAEICQISGASQRYVRMLKSGNETEMEKIISESLPP